MKMELPSANCDDGGASDERLLEDTGVLRAKYPNSGQIPLKAPLTSAELRTAASCRDAHA